METELATDTNTNLNSQIDNSGIRDNEFVNESMNFVNNTPMNISESNVENNQMHCLQCRALKHELKPILDE